MSDNNISEDYDNFLSRISKAHGLAHVYDLFMGRIYLGHRIVVEDSVRENSFLDHLRHPLELFGEKYSAETVASFKEEPWFNTMRGCRSDKIARIVSVGWKYAEEISEISRKIYEYSQLRQEPNTVVSRRKKNALTLSVK